MLLTRWIPSPLMLRSSSGKLVSGFFMSTGLNGAPSSSIVMTSPPPSQLDAELEHERQLR